MADAWEEARRWRARAKEVRIMVDQFRGTDQREQLRRIAEGYDLLAKNAEARLRRVPFRPPAEADRVSGANRDTGADRRF